MALFADSETIMLINRTALNRARLRKGLFRSEVATQASISANAAEQAFRTGRCGLKVARAIAQVLGLRMQDILIEEEEPASDLNHGQDSPGAIAAAV